MALADLILR